MLGGDREDVRAGPGQHRTAPARAAVGSRSNDTGHCGGCRVTAHGKPGAATKRVQTKIFCLIFVFIFTNVIVWLLPKYLRLSVIGSRRAWG